VQDHDAASMMSWIPPVVLAPLAGGPSTPELAAAVADAGGLGFLAAGYLSPDVFVDQLRRARELTDGFVGVNLFVVEAKAVDEEALAAYAVELESEGELGEATFDDDWLEEKLDAAISVGVDVLSTTFGPPPVGLVDAAHAAGIDVWATVASLADARVAVADGADALVVQGLEAGGHRAFFDDLDEVDVSLLELLESTHREFRTPLIAAGGIADRATAEAARASGAAAVQAGSAFLLCPEAGTHPVHRAAVKHGGETAVTRAFTGRRARGIVNRFMREHRHAPSAYPQIHHLTAPLRAAARAAGDADRLNLWAGTRFAEARDEPAAAVVERLGP
jgi:nitronate monooxygenase